MSERAPGFADLIAPVSPDVFFADYWETAPLHIQRGLARFYDSILTSRDVEAAISFGGLRYPAIQLAKRGAFFPAETFSRNIRSGDDVFSGVPDLNRIQAEYQAGATISLPGFHRAWAPLGALAEAVETYFDHAVHTNIYITPGNATGFTPHYDTHDVFILQISGAKHWTVYAPTLALPHRSQTFGPQSDPQHAPLLEIDLEPGDLLYLPRGFVHSTRTSTQASIHVTLGITVYTWVELLAEWLQAAKADVRFRRALPPGFASRPELKQPLSTSLAELLADLRRDVDHGQLIEGFAKKVRAGLGGRGGEFHADVIAIGPLSRVRALAPGRYAIAERGGDILLIFAGKVLPLPRPVRPTLDEMCAAKSFCSADLKSNLGQDATLALVRHLHREGFLVVEN